jgi:glycosyltransferase involved in cell wall biosynthesis
VVSDVLDAHGEDRPAAGSSVALVVREEPGTTGTSRYVDRLGSELTRSGWRISHVDTRPGRTAQTLLRPVRMLGLDGASVLARYPLSMRWPKVDVVHVTVQTYASALAFRRPRVPVVVTVHDIIPLLNRRASTGTMGLGDRVVATLDDVAMRALRRADRLIADSDWTRDTLVELLRIAPDRIVTIPLGVDEERYAPRPVPATFRERYDLPPDRRYLLVVGSEDPRKNLTVAWQALPMVLARHPDVVLLKVGAGHDRTGRANLDRIASEQGTAAAVRVIDSVPEEDLATFYNAASALLMPSLLEGFGLPVVEAMASGTPVVTSGRSAMAELVEGGCARTFEADRPAELAAAIDAVLSDPGATAAMVERALARSTRFRWEAMGRATENVYADVIRERRAPGGARRGLAD